MNEFIWEYLKRIDFSGPIICTKPKGEEPIYLQVGEGYSLERVRKIINYFNKNEKN